LIFKNIFLRNKKTIIGERDGIVEELPSMCIMPTSNLLEVMGSIP